jgi:hypothetical protein
MKIALKGKRFQDVDMKNVTAELNAIPFKAFADGFQKLLERLTNIFK